MSQRSNGIAGFMSWLLWIAASVVALSVWSLLGVAILGAVDTYLINTPGPGQTPLWQAYLGLVFFAFAWPAVLLVLARVRPIFERMIGSILLAYAALAALSAMMAVALPRIVQEPVSLHIFGRQFGSPLSALLLAFFTAGAVIVTRGAVSRQNQQDPRMMESV